MLDKVKYRLCIESIMNNINCSYIDSLCINCIISHKLLTVDLIKNMKLLKKKLKWKLQFIILIM